MIEAKIPENEAQRLESLLAYGILDTDAEQVYDDLTRIASEICGVPIALVSLVDESRQWFKSKVGLDAPETPRSVAFCSHAILEPDELMVVPDSSLDERFRDNPLATGAPHVRFYAGAPLVTPEGHGLGTLCVIDNRPRQLLENQRASLKALARQVVSQLELRKYISTLQGLSGELQRAHGELEEFTRHAAHDLRAPLRQLISFSKLLELDLGDDLPAQAHEDILHIKRSAGRMDNLVISLLELSQAGQGEVKSESVSLEECVAHALESLGDRVGAAHVEIDPLPVAQGDFTLLTQVFQNLLGNALKFTDKDQPRVHVTVSSEGGNVVVGVKDNGIGMDPKLAGSIFAPFRRLHGRNSFEGTGIGLSIVKKIVERHGGRIWVEAQPGAGCHFQFTLPGLELPASRELAACTE